MIKRLMAALAVVALSIGIAAAPVAAAPIYGCNDAYVCVYSDANYSGGRYSFHVQNTYAHCWAYPFSGQPGWPNGQTNNKISSIILNQIGLTGSSNWITFYDGNTCTGRLFRVQANQSLTLITNLTSNPYDGGANWNDQIGSVLFNG